MIALSRQARRHVSGLLAYYEEHDRPEAARGLRAALVTAWDKITASPAAGLPAPRPYPQLKRPGWSWIKSGRYWIAYRTAPVLIIVAVFYETADIPRRL